MSRRVIEGSYARLTGIRDSLVTTIDTVVSIDFHDDYMVILSQLREKVDDPFDGFDLPQHVTDGLDRGAYGALRKPIDMKIRQLISYLEKVHNAASKIVEVGSVYNLIRDPELKSRCADLLSAHDHFDRVINQATQVLEERVRLKTPQFKDEIGIKLVNSAVKNDPAVSPIVFSDNQNEQEGFASILRGIVGAFRNTSHHRFMANVTREQALQICAFIDNMLFALDIAEAQH